MKTFKLVISSPDGDIFRDNVLKISLRGIEGGLAVMAGHIPFVTSVNPCDCRIELSAEEIKTGHTDGGILTVGKDSVTLISGTFEWK